MNSKPISTTRTLTLRWMACASIVCCVACADGPMERFKDCQERVSAGAALDKTLDCFSADSQKLLVALDRVESDSDGTLTYLADRDQLLDVEIDPEVEPDITGRLAILRTVDGHAVVMVQEDGDWRFDALELDRFWTPLVEAWETE